MSHAAAAPALEVEGVSVPFGAARGLEAVDLTVDVGERFVLVGASGAGKTSLLRAIAGAGPVTAGRIRAGGRSTASLPPRDRGVILLEQRPLLFPHLSVWDNVAFPLEVRRVPRSDIDARVADVLDAVRLSEFVGRKPHTLSGGQAHRAALARAVVARPRVLLLDEPLASLDPTLREEMRRAIQVVGDRYGTALLMVTHDLRDAGRIGERIGVLTGRRLAQVDTPEVLFRAPRSLAVARFIGWRNELPARLEEGGAVRVGERAVLSGVAVSPEEAPIPGAVTLCFGADGARVRRTCRESHVPARVTAVRHDPHGITVEYRFGEAEVTAGGPQAQRDGGAHAGGGPPNSFGELSVDADEVPRVGELVFLEILPARARAYPRAAHSGVEDIP